VVITRVSLALMSLVGATIKVVERWSHDDRYEGYISDFRDSAMLRCSSSQSLCRPRYQQLDALSWFGNLRSLCQRGRGIIPLYLPLGSRSCDLLGLVLLSQLLNMVGGTTKRIGGTERNGALAGLFGALAGP
jgi:hypothetical protein